MNPQNKITYLPDIHRLLPQSLDAEQGLLGSFMLDPFNIGSLCSERAVDESFFHMPAHATLFSVMLAMWGENQPIDFITLTAELRKLGKLDEVGGAAFVTGLFGFMPTAANAGYYLTVLTEKRDLRKIVEVGTEFAARAYDEQENGEALLDQFEEQATTIRKQAVQSTVHVAKALAIEAVNCIQKLYDRKGAIGGLATGLTIYDTMTDGLHPGELTIIAARPSMGKTALAMNIAEHISVELKRPVAVFSLEMNAQQLMQRMLCGRASVNLARVRDGILSERDFPAIQASAGKLAEAKLYIDDTSSLSIQDMRSRARKMKKKYGIEAIFVDYLQLMRSNSKRAQADKRLEVAEISAGLKAMSKELGVPVVALAQLNRKAEARAGNRPMLSDLAESGSIEQDADTVAMLFREEYYATTPEEKAELEGQATVIIAKQRNGPVGDIPLTFLKQFTRFTNRARSAEE